MPIVLVLGREWNTSWICFMVNIKQVVAAVLVIVIIARLLSRTRARTNPGHDIPCRPPCGDILALDSMFLENVDEDFKQRNLIHFVSNKHLKRIPAI